jgi:thiol-disulfide isomerase/thioredoxin
MKKRNIAVLFAMLLLVGVTIYTQWPQKKETVQTVNCDQVKVGQAKPQVGSCAPDFQLLDLEGKAASLSDNRGKPTLINFWATWCGPCQNELPHFEKAYQSHRNQINFMMVNATMTEPDQKAVQQYVKQKGYTFPVYLDTDETSISFDRYHIPGIPVTIAVDRQGRVIRKMIGEVSKQQIDQIVEQLATS